MNLSIRIFFSSLRRRCLVVKLILILICQLTYSNAVASDALSTTGLIVVINTPGNAPSFTKQQIRHIFMGGALSRKFQAINLPSGHPLRVQFNTTIIGLTESRIQSYWAQMKFTGRSKPPAEVKTTEELINYLLANSGAIAYFPVGTEIPSELTIIYP